MNINAQHLSRIKTDILVDFQKRLASLKNFNDRNHAKLHFPGSVTLDRT